MAVSVASDVPCAIGRLGSRFGVPSVARARERGLDHRLDELAHPIAQTSFDRIKPIVEERDRPPVPTAGAANSCYRCSWRGLHRRANAGIVWISTPGDYATFNSNQTPDGTSTPLPARKHGSTD
jgi:hypothetical protein